MARRTARTISLDYGGDQPLTLSPPAGCLIADCHGPDGTRGQAAGALVTEALERSDHGPPLASHVVAGDRVAVAVAGAVPQREQVMAAVRRCLEMAGVQPADVVVVHEPPEKDSDTAYLAADEEGSPLYLSRSLIDADVVVGIGCWNWDASLGGRSIEGELWPTFSRVESRRGLSRELARRGRHALAGWRTEMQEIAWQLGICASLRLVPGRDGTLAAAAFGLPDSAARAARDEAKAWSPQVKRSAMLTIASVSRPSEPWDDAGMLAATRAIAAAARVTDENGTICLVCRLAVEPGIIFSRWRQGGPLQGLVHEALAQDDPHLTADALQTRLFARALGDRRLVVLSDLPAATVEDLEFGCAESPAVVERLAKKSESLIVLHEADLMLPRV